MGFEDRLRCLKQSLCDEAGPPPGYYDARARRGRYVRLLMASAVGQEVGDEDLGFADRYRDSALKKSDDRFIERYTSLRSPEDAARVRARMNESLDAIVEKRRAHGL